MMHFPKIIEFSSSFSIHFTTFQPVIPSYCHHQRMNNEYLSHIYSYSVFIFENINIIYSLDLDLYDFMIYYMTHSPQPHEIKKNLFCFPGE